MRAWRQIWRLAGFIDASIGRVQVLAAAFAAATAVLLFLWIYAIRDLGFIGLAALVCAALFGLLAISLTIDAWHLRPRPSRFPDVLVDATFASQREVGPTREDSIGGVAIELTMLVTNREQSDRISLEFRLLVVSDGEEVGFIRPSASSVPLPLNLGPGHDSPLVQLIFRVHHHVADKVRTNEHPTIAFEDLRLRVTDRVSGEVLVLNVPTSHPDRIRDDPLGMITYSQTISDHEDIPAAARALRDWATPLARVKILIHPPHKLSLARKVASVFELAGWNTELNETPQERFTAAYVEGIEIRGVNRALVMAVRDALAVTEIPDLLTRVDVMRIDRDNPKYDAVMHTIRITIGHTVVS